MATEVSSFPRSDPDGSEAIRRRLRSTPMPRSPFLSPARAIGDVAPAVLKGVNRKRGFAYVELLLRWREIVGSDIASVSRPSRLVWPRSNKHDRTVSSTSGTARGAVLEIAAHGPMALELHYHAQMIIAQVNSYFGYSCVSSIRVQQIRPDDKPEPVKPKRPRRVGNKRKILGDGAELSGIKDTALRQALLRFAQLYDQQRG